MYTIKWVGGYPVQVPLNESQEVTYSNKTEYSSERQG